jgi:hypothetical protein
MTNHKSKSDRSQIRTSIKTIHDLFIQGNIREALETPLGSDEGTDLKRKKIEILFEDERKREEYVDNTLLGGLVFGDFLYDWASIDPEVIKAADFLYKVDIDGPISFGVFAKEKFSEDSLGRFLQLRGYVAEQKLAALLRAQGYEVSFPESATQAGYDMTVDGQLFQVKCADNIDVVLEHFRNYPDIPVIANSELMDEFEEIPEEFGFKVFFTDGFSLEKVETVTRESLEAGDELFDSEIPIFVTAISTARNVGHFYKGEKSAINAAAAILAETGSRMGGLAIGGLAGKAAGLVLFGPAGGYVFSGIVGVYGAMQGRKILDVISDIWARGERNQIEAYLKAVLNAGLKGLEEKKKCFEIRRNRICTMMSELKVNEDVIAYFGQHFEKEACSIEESERDLKYAEDNIIKLGPHTMGQVKNAFDKILRSRVHPIFLQGPMDKLLRAIEIWKRKRMNPISA